MMARAIDVLGTGKFKKSTIDLVQNTADYILKLQLPSGNLPPFFEYKTSDLIVSFDHGATGAIFLFLAIYN